MRPLHHLWVSTTSVDRNLLGVTRRRSPWAAAASALCLAATAAAWASPAVADTAALNTLMLRNNCTACHLIDKRKYGPNFLEVAERYAGKPGAVNTLATKIKAGGNGVWGDDIMPPQPQVKDADARAMAELILALKR